MVSFTHIIISRFSCLGHVGLHLLPSHLLPPLQLLKDQLGLDAALEGLGQPQLSECAPEPGV